MPKYKNVLVGQSGGPTAVINSSLAGVISEALKSCEGKVYGAVNGIKGILRNELIELNETFSKEENIELLKQTPSSYLGSCRYKIAKDSNVDIDKIFEIFEKNEIGSFFYIGGNDSMDTVMRLSNDERAKDMTIIGVPKTIDNDLLGTDHCPGYGSCAKYIATVVSEMALDASCYDIKNVLIVEIMGRNAGWLTASAALARTMGNNAPDFIYLPEVAFDTEKFLFDIRTKLANQDTVIVAVSEGIKDADGTYIAESKQAFGNDMFGHGQLGGVGKKLENLVKDRLGIKVRSVELNLVQRCAAHITSKTDVEDAFTCGVEAVKAAAKGESGKMVCMIRKSDEPYEISFECKDINTIANGEKMVPQEFITPEGTDVTDAFVKYALPLIMGENDIKYKDGIPAFIKR
ncbi:MAG: 6-phosphofructokinase [Clostridia bacterium]|nr:6-phosphofructokinase [Clostridia bacterium]